MEFKKKIQSIDSSCFLVFDTRETCAVYGATRIYLVTSGKLDQYLPLKENYIDSRKSV